MNGGIGSFMTRLCLLFAMSQLYYGVAATGAVKFLSVGDWGSASLGGYHLHNAEGTAAAMKAYIANGGGVAFVLNTGDNFYYCGIQNTSDPQISEDYTALFGGMGVPWYHSLGNHDYGFSPEAQLQLNETITEWNMDDRYYHRRIELSRDSGVGVGVGMGMGMGMGMGIIVNIIVLDTNPCVKDYRGTDRRRWDPCGTQYPDCSPIAEPCRFHENIISQDCDLQLSWAKSVLANIPNGEWVFVVGHHKAEEINVADFQTTILDDPRVHLYLNGHTHNLEHYSVNGQAKYMTTGAGGMVIIGNGVNNNNFHDTELDSNKRRNTTKPVVKSIWSKIVTGFTSHVFDDAGTTLTTYFWNIKQNNSVYSFDVKLV
jgi:hypothetical protein